MNTCNNSHLLSHGQDYAGQDVTHWLCSEKLDGCRALWDGSLLWTRQGCRIDAPQEFTRGLPGVPLDGEIWAGRESFALASSAVRSGRWSPAIRFMVFDAPEHSGTWTDRMAEASRLLVGRRFAASVAYWTVQTKAQLESYLVRVFNLGGEGLILRNPTAQGYRPGRSVEILKVKTFSQLQ